MTEWKKMSEYEISDDGRIRKNGKYLKGSITPKGYVRVNINGRKTFLHRIVAKLFIREGKKDEQINHKNGIKTDNRVENLEWVSPSENLTHAYRVLGRKAAFEGKHIPEIIRKKISESNKGRKITDEWRKKISESHKGLRLLDKNPNSKAIICITNGKKYGCIKEASLDLKIHPTSIGQAIIKNKSVKKLYFKEA